MKKEEVYECLCYKDQRNPYWQDIYGWQELESEEIPEPRKGCFCDNCFSGRDRLALEILKIAELLAFNYDIPVVKNFFTS